MRPQFEVKNPVVASDMTMASVTLRGESMNSHARANSE